MISDLNDLTSGSRSPQSLDEKIDNITMPSTFLDDSNQLGNVSSSSALNYSKVSDVDNSFNWTENSLNDSSSMDVSKPKNRSVSQSSEIQNFRQLSQDVNRNRMRYNRTQLLINIMDDVFSFSSELSPELKEKCLYGLRNYQLNSLLKCNSQIQNAINISIPLDEIEFSPKEINLIRSVMKNFVSAKCSQLKTENELILDVLSCPRNKVSLPGSLLNEEEGIILNQMSNTATLIEQCAENIKSIIRLNDELYDVRATKFRELQKVEVESLESKTKLISLQIKNLNYMIEDAFIQQFDEMTEAVTLLYKELQLSLHEAEYMLQKTQILKDKYDQVRGTRFEEILNEYKQLRDNYKHKAWALKQISNS